MKGAKKDRRRRPENAERVVHIRFQRGLLSQLRVCSHGGARVPARALLPFVRPLCVSNASGEYEHSAKGHTGGRSKCGKGQSIDRIKNKQQALRTPKQPSSLFLFMSNHPCCTTAKSMPAARSRSISLVGSL